MKVTSFSVLCVGFLAGCAGDNHVTTQSGVEPVRHAERGSAASEINRPNVTPARITPGRVYLITRLETADQPRGEWRAQGETIRERGSDIEFIKLGSGKTV